MLAQPIQQTRSSNMMDRDSWSKCDGVWCRSGGANRSRNCALQPSTRLPEVQKILAICLVVVVGKTNGFGSRATVSVSHPQHPGACGLVASIAKRQAGADANEHRLLGDRQFEAIGAGLQNAVAEKIWTSEDAIGLSRTSIAFSHAPSSMGERTQTSPGYFRLGSLNALCSCEHVHQPGICQQ
jgi:hypothetical protein